MSKKEILLVCADLHIAERNKKFGNKAKRATYKEMKQLHDRISFQPTHPRSMTPSERKKALESLIFLTEKRDGRLKARTCAKVSTQREYMTKVE